MFYDTNLPPHLRALKEEIEGYARGYGLDFFETIFEVIDADELNEIAALEGLRMNPESRVRLDVVRQNLLRMWSST